VYILYLISTHFTFAKFQYGAYLEVSYNTRKYIEMLVYEQGKDTAIPVTGRGGS
jgi:hypothetical protein